MFSGLTKVWNYWQRGITYTARVAGKNFYGLQQTRSTSKQGTHLQLELLARSGSASKHGTHAQLEIPDELFSALNNLEVRASVEHIRR